MKKITIDTRDYRDPKILLTCDDDVAIRIAKLLNLKFNQTRFRKISRNSTGIYEVRPYPKRRRHPILNLQNQRDKSYRYLPDFDSSREFYEVFRQSDSKSKIIYDEYSALRGKELLLYINHWESSLRTTIASLSSSNENLESQIKTFSEITRNEENRDPIGPYRKTGPDNKLACMDLSNLIKFINYLVNEGYGHPKTIDKEIVSGAEYINKIRNSCCHLRVLTRDEYLITFNGIYLYQMKKNTDSWIEINSLIKEIFGSS